MLYTTYVTKFKCNESLKIITKKIPRFVYPRLCRWDISIFPKKYESWRRAWALEISRGRLATPSTRFRWRTLSQLHALAVARFCRRTLSQAHTFAGAHSPIYGFILGKYLQFCFLGLQSVKNDHFLK